MRPSGWGQRYCGVVPANAYAFSISISTIRLPELLPHSIIFYRWGISSVGSQNETSKPNSTFSHKPQPVATQRRGPHSSDDKRLSTCPRRGAQHLGASATRSRRNRTVSRQEGRALARDMRASASPSFRRSCTCDRHGVERAAAEERPKRRRQRRKRRRGGGAGSA